MKKPTEVLKYWHNPAEIIEALDAAGYVVVPREPTEAMLAAPDIAEYAWRNDDPVTSDEIKTAWQQMIEAALCTANKPG